MNEPIKSSSRIFQLILQYQRCLKCLCSPLTNADFSCCCCCKMDIQSLTLLQLKPPPLPHFISLFDSWRELLHLLNTTNTTYPLILLTEVIKMDKLTNKHIYFLFRYKMYNKGCK